MPSALRWFGAFVFTQLVEAPVYRRGLRVGWAFAALPSALTHPLLWFVIFPRLSGTYVQKVVLAELGVWACEALVCALGLAWQGRANAVHAAGVALLANALSLTLGLASRALLGLP